MAKMSRRTFLSRATTTMVGGIGALMGIPTVAYLVSPAKARGGLGVDRLPLGPISKFPVGEPTLFKAAIERKTGWVTQTEELAFYDALEVNDSAVKVLGDEVLRGIARDLVN